MSEWAFLIDENLEPKVARDLTKEGYRADYVPHALGYGAPDTAVLEYATEHDLVVVTNDAKDFNGLPGDAHSGIIVVFDNRLSAFQTVTGIFRIIDAYPGRLRGYEAVDDWL